MNSRLFTGAIAAALVIAGCATTVPGTQAPTLSAADQAFLASSATTARYNVMLASMTQATADATASATATTGAITGTTSTTTSATTSVTADTSLVTSTMQAHAALTNLATTKVACSSQRGDWFRLDNLTDGNLHSAWGAMADDTAPTLTFDLAHCTTLRGLGIKQSGGVSFDVAVSTGGGTWQVIGTDMTSETAKLDWVDLKATSADRVQLRFHGPNVSKLLVCEVQWFGDQCGVTASGGSPSPLPSTSTAPSTAPSTMPSSAPSTMPSTSPSTLPSVMPSVMPSTPTAECGCKVTGGGWVALGNGKGHNKVTFGFVAMEKDGQVKGQVEINDHATKTKWHGRVDALTCSGDQATFSGTLTDGTHFTVSVADNGEPGINDRFSFSTAAGISLHGLLGGGVHGGGNIKIHHEDCDDFADKVKVAIAELADLDITVTADASADVTLDLSTLDALCDRDAFKPHHHED